MAACSGTAAGPAPSVVAPIATPPVADAPAPWVDVASDEGGFKAQFPIAPIVRRENEGRLIYELDTDEARFVVQSVPIHDDTPAEKIMSAVIAGVQAGGTELIDARSSTPDGMLQLDARIVTGGLPGQIRLIVDPHHRVLIFSVKFLGQQRSELAERFFAACVVLRRTRGGLTR